MAMICSMVYKSSNLPAKRICMRGIVCFQVVQARSALPYWLKGDSSGGGDYCITGTKG